VAKKAPKTVKNPTKAKKESAKYADQELVDKVVGMFQQSWDYVSGSWHQRWEDNYNLYNNERVKRGYDGITDTFVPMTFSTIETMTSALFGTKPKFAYTPPKEKPDQETDILNSLLDYYWDKDQWSIKFITWGRGFLREGTSVVYLYWDGNCPKLINVPIRDFIIDPTFNGEGKPKFIGRRYLTTKEELESFEIVDLEDGMEATTEGKDHEKKESKTEEATEDSKEPKMRKKYKDLDKLGIYNSDKTTDKEIKDMWYGSTLDTPEENQVEVIEMWYFDPESGEDRVVSVANRCCIIENVENWYKTKARDNGEEYPQAINPFAWLRDYVDGSLFYAKSEVDFISDQQELLNDLTNQNIDSITYTLNQMYTLDPKYAHMIDEVENLPGAVYPFEAGTLQPIPMGNVPQDAFNERLNIKSEMRETTASNEIVKGVGAEGGSITATEVNAQIAGAGQRIGLKITQIEDEGFHKLAQIVFAMVRLYVNEPMMVRIIGKDGIRWEEFDPKQFKDGDYEPRVQLETSVNSQKAQDAESAKELLAGFLNDPGVNQEELKKMVFRKSFDLDPDEIELLIAPQLPPEMGGMPTDMPIDPMAGGVPPVDPAMLAPVPMPPEMAAPPELALPPMEQPLAEATQEQIIEAVIDPLTGQLVPLDPAVADELALLQGGVL